MDIIKYGSSQFEYEKEDMVLNNLPELTHEDAKNVLFLTQDLLAECNLKMFLAYGTLLGAIRDKDFIKGDLDVDVYVEDEERLFLCLAFLQERGLKLVRAISGDVYSFRISEKCYIDIYIKRPLQRSIWSFYCCSLAGTVVPKKFFRDETTINFLGRTFICVKDPEKLLEFWYGKTWIQPIGKFEQEYIYEVKSHYYYKTYLRAIKDSLHTILGDNIYYTIKNAFKRREI